MTKKLTGNLILEVTRDCQLNCPHCLRGPKECKTMSREIIDRVLENYSYITQITFTGGEPSLAADTIQYTLDKIKEKNIGLGGFYIATNGVGEQNLDFIKTILELYQYSKDKDMCGVSVSVDKYHINLNNELYKLYSELTFYRNVKKYDDNVEFLVVRGNAENNNLPGVIEDVRDYLYVNIYSDTIKYDGVVYVNVNGDVVFDCDLSYKMQEEYKVGNVLSSNLNDIVMDEYHSLLFA